ncbi:MAG: hypothetical protein HON70_01510 [Lentisphaerae bacterium]|jgi:hypothetical protein|nr:hypothetical protein [Lentisphaerota bacterium]
MSTALTTSPLTQPGKMALAALHDAGCFEGQPLDRHTFGDGGTIARLVRDLLSSGYLAINRNGHHILTNKARTEMGIHDLQTVAVILRIERPDEYAYVAWEALQSIGYEWADLNDYENIILDDWADWAAMHRDLDTGQPFLHASDPHTWLLYAGRILHQLDTTGPIPVWRATTREA